MVLVDADRDDRAYFATTSDPDVFVRTSEASQNNYYLDLNKFSLTVSKRVD